jgi:hypothetical protein
MPPRDQLGEDRDCDLLLRGRVQVEARRTAHPRQRPSSTPRARSSPAIATARFTLATGPMWPTPAPPRAPPRRRGPAPRRRHGRAAALDPLSNARRSELLGQPAHDLRLDDIGVIAHVAVVQGQARSVGLGSIPSAPT